jgi:hypothetical protein
MRFRLSIWHGFQVMPDRRHCHDQPFGSDAEGNAIDEGAFDWIRLAPDFAVSVTDFAPFTPTSKTCCLLSMTSEHSKRGGLDQSFQLTAFSRISMGKECFGIQRTLLRAES